MGRRPSSAHRHVRPRLEDLEVRNLLSTFVVDHLADDNTGTGPLSGDLRYCLATATDGDTITFSVTGTINLTSALPNIAHNITIQGPGASQLTVQRSSGGDYSVFKVTSPAFNFFGATNVTISGLTIANGHAANGGGVYNTGNLVLDSDVITGNTATNGGGVYSTGDPNNFFNSTTLTLKNTTVTGNAATSGGGIYNDISTNNFFFFSTSAMTVDHSTITKNAAAHGGGIFNNGGGTNFFSNAAAMSITASSVTFNSTTNDDQDAGGGGIWNNGTMTIDSSTVANNSASALAATGGGIDNTANGTLTITNSTIALNAATASSAYTWTFGGGIYNVGKLNLTNDTIAANTAHGGSFGFGIGGGVYNENGLFNDGVGSTTMGNTIIAANASDFFGTDLFGSVTSKGHNLVSNSFGGDGYAGSDLLNLSPNLGPLQNNGGPTQTMALLPGSLGIDAGDNSLVPFGTNFDQRGTGFNRIVNGTVDIGAYEFGNVPPMIVRSLPGQSGNSGAVSALNNGSSSTASGSSAAAAPVEQPPSAGTGSDSSSQAGTPQTPSSMLDIARNLVFAELNDSQLQMVW
jgi:hypothetical protein